MAGLLGGGASTSECRHWDFERILAWMDTDPQPPLPCPLINTALPQSNNPLFQLRVPLVELQKMVALGPIVPLLSCPRGLLGLSCCSTPSCPCATTPRAEKVQGAAPGRAQCRCTKNQGQRGAAAAPEGRTWPPTAPAPSCPRGLSCCSTPRSARAQRRHRARGKARGAAPGRAQCRCTKNQGQRGAAAAPEGRTWPPTAPAPSCPRGL